MVNRLQRTAVLLVGFATGFHALAGDSPPVEEQAPSEAEPPPSVAAVFKLREVSFQYRSAVALYSCDALKDRVASILRAMGARDDVQVKASDCFTSMMPPELMSDPFPPGPSDPWRNSPASRYTDRSTNREQMVHVRISVMWPTEITPQILAEMKKDASRRDLISRVTGNPAARLNDPVIFQAARQQFTLSRTTIGIEPIECELLDQMSTSVFRKLDVRVINRSLLCDRSGVSRIPPQITVETLAPLPIGAVRQPSLEGDGNADPAAEEDAPAGPDPAR